MHIARDDSLLGTIRFVSRYADTQVYGTEPLKSRKSQKKSGSAISSEESPSKKKSAKAKKDAATKPKPTKNKAYVKADRGKGLNKLSEVALSEAAQLKEATKQSKKYFHISQVSSSGDGTNFELRVLDEQHRKTFGADEGTVTKPRDLDVPKYDSKSNNESLGDSEKEDDDDDKDDTKDNEGNDDDDNDDNDGDDNDANDDDNQEDYDKNNDDEEIDKEEENIDDEEKMDKEEDDEVTKELYKDVNVNLGNVDAEMTNADQGGADQQNV
ncbi:hypothetical protein Tco_0913057 [Tanacetum coccineum]